MLAASKGMANVITELTKHEIGMTHNEGLTALMHACVNNRPDCTLLLLHEAGIVNSKHESSLMFAAGRCCTQAVGALKEMETGLEDKDGNTALAHVIKNNQNDCAQLLMEEADKANSDGMTALM